MTERPEAQADPATPSPQAAPGPLARHLARMVREHVTCTNDAPTVWASPRNRLGDFVVEFGPEYIARPGALDSNATRLAAAPGIARTRVIPPKVYVTTDLALLRETVVGAINADAESFGAGVEGRDRLVVVSFSDPNLNKPLHLGHFRNNVVGMAIGEMLANQRWRVERHAVHSDWGRHICQAVWAYLRFGGDRTPESDGVKGDHFVGRFYRRFHEENARLRQRLGTPDDVDTELDREVAELMLRLDAQDAELRAVNDRLTTWTEQGIRATYDRIGTRLDRIFREFDTTDVARRAVLDLVDDGVCVRRANGTVYVDVGDDLPQLTMLRADGTALVYAQWLGVDIVRFDGYDFDWTIQLSGAQWESSERLYAIAMERMGFPWASRCSHIQYGMVKTGQDVLRSRRGKVPTTDDTLDELRDALVADPAAAGSQHVDPVVADRYAVAALKYFVLRAPRGKDFDIGDIGLHGPSYEALVRLTSVLGGAHQRGRTRTYGGRDPVRALLLRLDAFPSEALQAARDLEPSRLVRFADQVAELTVMAGDAIDPAIVSAVRTVLRRALACVNIVFPEDQPPLRAASRQPAATGAA